MGLLVVTMVATTCGRDSDTTTASITTTSSTTAAPTTESTGETTTATSTTGSTTSESPTTLPGEPFDLFIESGDVLGVVGVQYDDVLNLRSAPGTDQDVVATAVPLAADLVATGRERLLPNSIWYEVTTADDVTGWASAAFLAYVGVVDDATAEWRSQHALGEVETIVELAETIASTYASEDPPSRIVRSDAGGVGDLADTTYDVVGVGDDSQLGWRLHVLGTPSGSGEGFFLKSIERTLLCYRGVTAEGICV